MQKTKQELYKLVSDVKTKKQFEQDIKKRYQEYEGLLNEDAIALYIVDELGRNTQVITQIGDIEPNKEYAVVGTVTAISDLKIFKRKDGTAGKVINLEISDESGTCRLVLWNDEIDIVKNKDIHKGTIVRIINGYTKGGYTGVELHLGRWGLLEVEPAEKCSEINFKKNDAEEITGVLIHKESTRAFFKDNGEVGFVTTITLTQKKKETQVTIWDNAVKDVQQCKIGETVSLKNITIKQVNNTTEYHCNGTGIIRRHT